MPPKKGHGNKPNAPKLGPSPAANTEQSNSGGNKKKKKDDAHSSAQDTPSEPPKPTARQVIGGTSWTGKLPVNLLSEHCQRQKWNKPDYSMRQLPAKEKGEKLYRSDVTLSKTDPKTRETTTLPPIRLPPPMIELADQPSALEARHFAATYALFRIQSMKNVHMMLPPNYRDLWKGEFSRLKKEDVAASHGWKYDEDPFAAEEKRKEIHKAMEKRQEEDKKEQEASSARGGTSDGPGGPLQVHRAADSKAWERAPDAVMGPQIRVDVGEAVRQNGVWNQYGLNLSDQQRAQITDAISSLGFRKSHIEEALEYSKDQQEAIEWLLIHVPEDDLPSWTFPPNYNAGITLASGNLEKEAKLKRLASAGYPPDLCAQMLQMKHEDEDLAAFALQNMLVPSDNVPSEAGSESTPAWKEETETLSAIFGGNFVTNGGKRCSVTMSTSTGKAFVVHFRCPSYGYPDTTVPALSINVSDVPAYVRLSATKRAVEYAQFELKGEVMMYNICQWLEVELPEIMKNPGRLLDLHMSATVNGTAIDSSELTKGKAIEGKNSNRRQRQTPRKDRRLDTEIQQDWKNRQIEREQGRMMEIRQRLPAWPKREEILYEINGNQVTIISGETGSGKSTQVVQFVLDQAIQRLQGSQANILCTQPRRVATLSLADRVASERCSQVGEEVGYIIRGESKTSFKTKITFMTTGVLLRRLQSFTNMREALADVTHVFIDEVHERSLDTDFLLALLKECMSEQPELKIVLMSATLDADIFSNYFGGSKKVGLVHIKGRTYPVQDLYLEDVISLTKPDLDHAGVGKAIQSLGFGINYDLIRELVLFLDQDLGSQKGSILIFLPGTLEIERCLRSFASDSKILGLPLHASLLPAEQRRVFPAAPTGRRKIVAATNVAETSITIEDIVAVIDTGKVKETSYDVASNIVRLEEVWASLAACKQRRGRAGRVRAGVCYKLFTRATESKMPSKNLPEIQRVPLEQLCLSVKATGADRDVADFLLRTLTPPDSGAVSNAIKALHVMNALDNDRLTALGTYLAMIPVDLRCAKLLVYGTLFDCLEPCLTIASILTVKSPFVNPRDKRDEANDARMSFPSTNGDLMLDMKAYEKWADYSANARSRDVQDWCSSHFVSQQTMRDIASSRRQIVDSLKDAGMIPLEYRSPIRAGDLPDNTEQSILLTALIAAALQPQVALISFPSKKYIASMSGAKELDPEARTIKFFIADESSTAPSQKTTPISSRPGTPKPTAIGINSDSKVATEERIPPLSRVFVHPASCLFSAQSFPRHSTHLSYFTKMMTTKPFIRDLTPLNIYTLLLFGGKLELDTLGRGLTVGGIWRVRGWARIGVLISRLRVLLDEQLRQTIDEGGVLLGSMSNSKIVQLVKRLLVLNGQDK